MAVFSGASSQYTVTDNLDSTYEVSGAGSGTDTITNIEQLEFSDGTFSISDLLTEPPANEINGTSGNDTITGTNGDDTINGLGGNDTIYGAGGDDIITVGNGFNSVYGGSGSDVLNAGNGFSDLFGGGGDDVLIAGNGFSTLDGGAGSDTFVFSAGQGTISDFSAAENDQIEIDRTDINNWADVQAVIASSGPSDTLEFNGGNNLTLTGVNVNSLQESDFIFS